MLRGDGFEKSKTSLQSANDIDFAPAVGGFDKVNPTAPSLGVWHLHNYRLAMSILMVITSWMSGGDVPSGPS